MGRSMRIGISTCPNDTFAFAALLEGRVGGPALEICLMDIQTLNEKLASGELEIGKASFHAALHLATTHCVLPVGAALGFGVGPLLLKSSASLPDRPGLGHRVLCPGLWTTASLLYRFYCEQGPPAEQVVFSQIMPALRRGAADYGVVIHEGRFCYEQQGLALALDLGREWEEENRMPLPLGGLLASRALSPKLREEICTAIRRSLLLAQKDPRSALPMMRRHAQDFDDALLLAHVDLYVNEHTMDLGALGKRALQALEERARKAGLVRGTASLFS